MYRNPLTYKLFRLRVWILVRLPSVQVQNPLQIIRVVVVVLRFLAAVRFHRLVVEERILKSKVKYGQQQPQQMGQGPQWTQKATVRRSTSHSSKLLRPPSTVAERRPADIHSTENVTYDQAKIIEFSPTSNIDKLQKIRKALFPT